MRRIERGIPWPAGKKLTERGWQRLPKFKTFLRRECPEIDHKIPFGELRLLAQWYELRCQVHAGIIDASTSGTRFERRIERSGIEADKFFEERGEILRLIIERTAAPHQN